MTINELLALNNLTAIDKIPVWDAEATGSTEPTAKITAQNFANAVKSLASLIGTGDLDATPTQGSTRAVQSGGVYTAISQSTANLVVTGFFESDTISVGANGNASTTIYPSKTGYTAVAIVGISSFSSVFTLSEFNISGSGTISIAGHNMANAQISGKITVRVLFVRNT